VFNDDPAFYDSLASNTEYADAGADVAVPAEELPPPLSLTDTTPPEMWDLTLDEAIRTALRNSTVLRDLGGTILRSPALLPTIYEPALETTNPRFGTEAALSAFDAEFSTQMYFAKNDRALNNLLAGGGSRIVEQDLAMFESQISKQAATGSTFVLRHNIDYDANNAPANLFPSAWNVKLEGEFRQPLLQGAGVTYNRIAGPDGAPGAINGIVIARIDSNISQVEFEIGVRNFISNVENAYWDLYYAYRDLDARISARDASLETWRVIKTWSDVERRGGEKEAQAREQYFRFEEDVQDALSGRLVERTRTNNGSSGGTFRPFGGVHVAERQLRLLMGLPPTDGRLIRPADGPVMAKVVFDWSTAVPEAMAQRAELRRQRLVVQRRQKELIASQNFLLPRMDVVGLYRWRGFGNDLLRTQREGLGEFDNAYQNLTGGDYQEWQLGLELSMPLGFRQGFAAVKNAKLQLARDTTVLHEQERQIAHDLSDAVAEVERAFVVAQTAYNRRIAAQENLQASQVAFDRQKTAVTVDLLLDAQQRLADADSRYYRVLVEYALAIRNVHFEKGTLLNYNGVYLAEAPTTEGCGLPQPKRQKLLDFTCREPLATDLPGRTSAVTEGQPLGGASASDQMPGEPLIETPREGTFDKVIPGEEVPTPPESSGYGGPATPHGHALPTPLYNVTRVPANSVPDLSSQNGTVPSGNGEAKRDTAENQTGTTALSPPAAGSEPDVQSTASAPGSSPAEPTHQPEPQREQQGTPRLWYEHHF